MLEISHCASLVRPFLHMEFDLVNLEPVFYSKFVLIPFPRGIITNYV